jgi:hypothetical protein
VKGKLLLPVVLMTAFALLPFATMLTTDLLLNRFYYHTTLFGPEMVGNYLAYAALVWAGSKLGPKMSFLKLLAGGLLGALLFYFLTNTFSWLFNPYNNPEYTKNLAGWLTALTMGTHGWPQTWEFFRNTFTSTGLFTALFAGAMKAMEALEPEEQENEEPAEEAEGEAQPKPEEAKV